MRDKKQDLNLLLEDMGRMGPESLHSDHKDWLVCNDCGQVQYVVALAPEHDMLCFNCGAQLNQAHSRWFESGIALAFAALGLFLVSIFFSILSL